MLATPSIAPHLLRRYRPGRQRSYCLDPLFAGILSSPAPSVAFYEISTGFLAAQRAELSRHHDRRIRRSSSARLARRRRSYGRNDWQGAVPSTTGGCQNPEVQTFRLCIRAQGDTVSANSAHPSWHLRQLRSGHKLPIYSDRALGAGDAQRSRRRRPRCRRGGWGQFRQQVDIATCRRGVSTGVIEPIGDLDPAAALAQAQRRNAAASSEIPLPGVAIDSAVAHLRQKRCHRAASAPSGEARLRRHPQQAMATSILSIRSTRIPPGLARRHLVDLVVRRWPPPTSSTASLRL